MQVITTHENSDFDGLASMVAAKKFYPHAVASFPGSLESSLREFLSTFQIPIALKKPQEIDIEAIELLILVDTKSPRRIGPFSEALHRKNLEVHIYDHHPFNENDIRGQKEIIEKVGAATTIFIEKLMRKKIPISPLEATILAIGIYEETGSLIFSSTTERDLKAAAHLLKKGANLNIVSNFINRELNREEVGLLNDLVQGAKDYLIHNTKVTIAKASRETYKEDIAMLAHKLKEFEGTDVLVLLVNIENRTHMILRSHVSELNVSEVAKIFGGGGHPKAASATVKNATPAEIVNELMRVLKEKIKPIKKACDIMTTPVKTIAHNSSIKVAEQTLTKYEINVLPVLKNNAFYGLISREAVEKALFHGFGKAKVSQFCSTEVLFVNPSTPVEKIESDMIEKHQRFMPVLEGELIKGAITRTDILRNIYEEVIKKYRLKEYSIQEKVSMKRNLASLMEETIPAAYCKVLRISGEVAEELGFSAFLVGGAVRDLLRGETNLDIDIVIEGDGIIFAKKLAQRLKSRMKSHEKFKTAVVITEKFKLDVATARTELYESPGALPKIEESSIKKDLYRRDFTINTLAVNLTPKHYGQLIDFFGGRNDIKDKSIKVLHSLSFIEDPTRAFRAVRFAERFGYKISKHTLHLIKIAIEMDVFKQVSGKRFFEEFNHILRETEPSSSLTKLESLGLLKIIHPEIRISNQLKQTLIHIHEAVVWFRLLFLDKEPDRASLFFMGLLESLKPEDRKSILKKLSLSPGSSQKLRKGIHDAKKALRILEQPLSPSGIYSALHPLSLESLLLAMGLMNDQALKKKISLYLTELRKVKLSITGKDLKAMGYQPGPIFSKILLKLLEVKLDGNVKNKSEEIAYIKKNFPI